MDPNEMPAVPRCPSDAIAGRKTGARWGLNLGPRRAARRRDRCYRYGVCDQIEDQEHLCLIQTPEGPKRTLFPEHCRILHAEDALKMEQRSNRKNQGPTGGGPACAKAHSHTWKLTPQAGLISPPTSPPSCDSTVCQVLVARADLGARKFPAEKRSAVYQCEAHPCANSGEDRGVWGPVGVVLTPATIPTPFPGSISNPTATCTVALGKNTSPLGASVSSVVKPLHPKGSADQSSPRIFVSALDASTLEEATNNFSFQEDPQAPFPGQHDPAASDQESASSEWQQKLEAAEALLLLGGSFQVPSGSTSLLHSHLAPAAAGEPQSPREPQPPSSPLQPMPASSVSLPIGHLGCISLFI